MRILALDQATISTGWAIIDNGILKKSGVIYCSRGKERDILQRSMQMVKEISSVIDKSLADIVVIQDVQNQSNNSTFKHLARLQGMIIGYCITYQYKYRIISPSIWRKELNFDMGRSIRRNNLKVQAVQLAYDKHKRHVGNDEADAICMATAAYNIIKREEEENDSKAKRKKNQDQGEPDG